MSTVVWRGKNEGISKIPLISLQIALLGKTLEEAAQTVTRLFEGDVIEFEIPDTAVATSFADHSVQMGVCCCLREIHQ